MVVLMNGFGFYRLPDAVLAPNFESFSDVFIVLASPAVVAG